MAASADYDPIIVDGELSVERINELLSRTRESAKLDFKRTLNLGDTADKVELTKDIVAMANSAGGYVVIGMDDDGTPRGLSDDVLGRIDEATIRRQVEAFIGASLELFVDRPVLWREKSFCIITVLRSPRSPLVFHTIGQYERSGAKRPTVVFRAGDVYVRRGSASQPWDQNDVDAIYARVVERERERWLATVLPDLRQLIAMAGGGSPPPPDARALMMGDAESLERALRAITPGVA